RIYVPYLICKLKYGNKAFNLGNQEFLTSEAQTKKSIADIGISAPSAKLI
ncbi:uncharacterized protein K441DRAFT_663079, partial [Cenococcum geophilum 1.58]